MTTLLLVRPSPGSWHMSASKEGRKNPFFGFGLIMLDMVGLNGGAALALYLTAIMGVPPWWVVGWETLSGPLLVMVWAMIRHR
jgi:hypothetical protein